MISPHTPPGTKIVRVNDQPIHGGDRPPIREGCVYTVAGYMIEGYADGKPRVLLSGIVWFDDFWQQECGFNLLRFRYAELPKVLTDLLNHVPAPELEQA